MAKIITFGIQKGGVGKSTTSGITSYLLSQKGYKVLAIDMDSQGNLTQFLSGTDDLSEFEDKTIREAMEQGDVNPYIRNCTKNLDYVPADDYLVGIAYYRGKRLWQKLLDESIESVKDKYDFIILDTPPALSAQTINAICATDYIVIMFETSRFCYNAIPRFIDMINKMKNDGFNPKIKIAGILTTLADNRTNMSQDLVKLVRIEYPTLAFKTVIKRKASIAKMPFLGLLNDSRESKRTKNDALVQYEEFLEELLERIK